ncbi:glycosyltransferase family 9 protein [Crossiella sp. CA198]|uniref:glycosyltransferase family 9 protein n=1 Tax=Crossiella sp. CA198 TaxID=3455607 RepID=UPI003F8D1E29
MSAPEVLVLRALGLGDLLTAVPALRALRRTHFDARITLAAPEWLAGLLGDIGAVDRLLTTDGLTEALRWQARPPDLAVNLHGPGPQSTALLRDLDPVRLIAFDPAHWREEEHEVHRWCRLLTEHGIPADPTDLRLPRPWCPSPVRGAVVLHIGASHASRHWPAERFAELARRLPGHVVLTGSLPERPRAQRIAELAGLPPERVLAGYTGLMELAPLVATARLLVCGDTGVAHLATAYRTPSVVLFGPVSPARWGPPPQRPEHLALWAGVSSDPFDHTPAPGLLRISVDEVLDAARRLLPRKGSRAWAHTG